MLPLPADVKMKLGILSDIHSRTDRFEASLALLADCEWIVCAGDIIDQCHFEGETVQLIHDRRVLAIKGNHDFSVCANPLQRHFVAGRPAEQWLHWLCRLPPHRVLTIEGVRVGIFHGSPWDDPARDFFHYVFPEVLEDLSRVATAGCDLVILGHTHRPMWVTAGGTTIVNPGSCGCGSPPTCAVFDTATGAVGFRVVNGR